MELGDCEVRRMALDRLQPAQYNPRRISDVAMGGLGKSIDRFGMLVPIVWNERTGNVVGGHQRLRHLAEAGESEVDVVVVDLDDQDEVALNITLNSPRLRGTFTKEVVGMLEEASESMGDAFAEIGLEDLHNFVKRLRFDEGAPPPPPPPPPDDGPQAEVVVTCPRCRSRWEMTSGRIVRNALEEQEVEDGEPEPVGDQEG